MNLNHIARSFVVLMFALCLFKIQALVASPCDQLVTPCHKIWDVAGGEGAWQNPDRWLPDNQVPISTTGVCIPIGAVVTVSSSSAEDAVALSILSSGQIIVKSGRKLTVYGDVSNQLPLILERDSEFVIGANMTYCGTEIKGLTAGDGSAAKINGTGTIRLQGTGFGEETVLTVRGHLDIAAPVINHARVTADNDKLTLSGKPKSGGKGGYWIAEWADDTDVAGKLIVNTQVSGSAKWLLVDHRDAIIEINAKCGKLSGDIDIIHGKLIINPTGSFWTTGDLLFVGEGNGIIGSPYETEIQVKTNATGSEQGSAFFGG